MWLVLSTETEESKQNDNSDRILKKEDVFVEKDIAAQGSSFVRAWVAFFRLRLFARFFCPYFFFHKTSKKTKHTKKIHKKKTKIKR